MYLEHLCSQFITWYQSPINGGSCIYTCKYRFTVHIYVHMWVWLHATIFGRLSCASPYPAMCLWVPVSAAFLQESVGNTITHMCSERWDCLFACVSS